LSDTLPLTPAGPELKRDAALYSGAGLAATLVFSAAAHAWLSLPLSGMPVAASIFAAFTGFIMIRLNEHSPHRALGPANRITLLRTALAATLAAMTLYPVVLASHGWVVTGLMVVTLALDGVDGWAARRFKVVSPFGARLDQELDALFTLILAFAVYRFGNAGAWILIVGAWHYVFHGLRSLSPKFRQSLPFSQRRRVVCALNLTLLIACASPAFQPDVATMIALAAVLLLSASFVIDIVWLMRR
jgi:phosphatidylglycerophosphate synthase